MADRVYYGFVTAGLFFINDSPWENKSPSGIIESANHERIYAQIASDTDLFNARLHTKDAQPQYVVMIFPLFLIMQVG